jgi:hypothetical protein
MAEAAPETKEPEIVYHYTSMDTMMKIARGASIWATSISYLNDVSEGDHFRKLIRERIPAYCQTHVLPIGDIFSHFLNAPASETFETRPFVASFSREADSLPQWRSYCPNGNGVAIGFRVDCLKRAFVEAADAPPTEELNVQYLKIEYRDSSEIESLDDEISKWAASAYQIWKHVLEHEKFEASKPGEYFKRVIDIRASYVKHPSFSNELEYRLLVDDAFSRRDCVEFRSTRSTLVPYIPVRIPRRHSRYADSTEPIMSPLAGRWDFIDRVVVGPTANSNLSLDAVSSFFRKNKIQVEVVSSTIPYRDW